MALRVNFIDFGVQIDNLLKKTSITLKPSAWETFVACRDKVAASIKSRQLVDVTIDEENDIRVSISIYNNRVYLHMRQWYKHYPTKTGVTFIEQDWYELANLLKPSAESELAKKVMTTMLRLETKIMVGEQCEGCAQEWPSQTDHDCLMNPAATATLAMGKAVDKIKPQDFIWMLAQEAMKEGIVLERPHETFKRIKMFQLEDIKNAIVELDYSF